MKKLFFILLGCLLGYSGLSQEPQQYFELYQLHNGNQSFDYRANDYIKLLPGFSYIPVSGQIFKGRIDTYTPFPIVYAENPIDVDTRELNFDLSVGTSAGSASVSLSGAATYQMPIVIPPGTAGMEPAISLVYNSQGGNGIMGYGWNLSGLSAITRVPQTIYHDEQVKGVDFVDDRFALDGNRLVVITGAYGTAGSVYYTEVFNASRITAYGTAGGGPEHFIVETKDGKKVFYGQTQDSRIEAQGKSDILIWNINRIEDRLGNYIEFSYREEGTQYWIEEIRYTGNDISVPPLDTYNKVHFYYSEREDKSVGFIAGSKVEQNVILTKIKTYAGSELVRKYDLNYYFNPSEYVIYSHLIEVKESNGEGESFNSTVFEWGEKDDSEIIPSFVDSSKEYIMGDYTGDGYTDYVTVPEDISSENRTVVLYKNDTDGTFSFFDSFVLPDWLYGDVNDEDYELVIKLKFDYNGDGFDDLLLNTIVLYPPEIPDPINRLVVFLFNENGYTGNYNWIHLESENGIYNTFVMGDFKGLGQTQLFCIMENGDWKIEGTNNLSYGSMSYSENYKFYANDFNGDGKDEILKVHENGYVIYKYDQISDDLIAIKTGGYPTIYHNIYLGDYNGDGLCDMLTSGEYLAWELYLWDGNDYIWENITPDLPYVTDDWFQIFYVYDFNGDTKDDILYFNSLDGTDEKFELFFNICNEVVIEQHDFYNVNIVSYELFFGDFDGDGSIDFKVHDEDNITGTQTEFFNNIVCFNSIYQNNLIKTTANGLNAITQFSYLPLTDLSIYNKGNGSIYPIIDFQAPIYAVENLSLDNGIGGFQQISYKYEGAKIHKHGKGFLGFTSVKQCNEIYGFDDPTYLEITNNFILEEPILGDNLHINPVLESTITQSKTEITENTWEYEPISEINYSNIYLGNFESTKTVFLSYRNSTTTEDILSNTKTKVDILDIDDRGNIESITTTYYADDGVTEAGTKSIITTYTSEGSWCNYLPLQITENQIIETQPAFTKVSNFNYDDNGLLIEEKTFSNLTPIITNYVYDDWGNVIEKVVSSGGITPRSISFTYDENEHRFILINTNVLGHESFYTYDGLTGNIITETTINNLVTKYDYDGFGSLIKTEYPDGNKSIQSFHWDQENPNEDILYYAMNVVDGSPTTKVYFDVLGREVLSGYENLENVMVLTKQNYNNNGQLSSLSEPYFEGSFPSQSTNYLYDKFGRSQYIISPPNFIEYSYNGKMTTIQNNSTGITKTTTINPFGLTANVTDPGGTITYTYYSSGLPHTISAPDGSISTMTYNGYGRQTELSDPDAGNSQYGYWPLGELAMQTDANGNIFYMNYDEFGRLDVKWDNTGETINYYYVDKGNGLEMIESIVHSNGTSYFYEYDEFSRLIKKTEIVDGQNYETEYTYDEFGNIETIEYPSGFKIENHYEKGYLTEVFDLTNQTLLFSIPANAYNAKGQLTDYYLGNTTTGIHTHKGYDQYGFPTSITTGTTQDLEYDFDPTTGNLNYRKDNLFGLQEDFTYDNAFKSRLTEWEVGSQSSTVIYQNNGNIAIKSDVGSYNYNDPVNYRPHAIYRITDPVSLPAETNQEITYNSFNSVKKIEHINQIKKLEFIYGPDQSRKKTVYSQNNVVQKTKYFIGGLYEKEVDALGNVREIHYIPGGNGLLALYIKVNGSGTMYYVLKDHLGSLYAITDSNGNIATYDGQPQCFSFDPWGNRRNPTDWTFTNVPSQFLIDRGFTGHEHLDVFGLINMNGRLYDPVLGRMLSPDNFVQSPDNSQGFNRYSYCLNNPLIYIDPSGEIFWAPIIIGALIGTYSGGVIANEGEYNLLKWDYSSGDTWGYMLGGAIVGGFSGYIGGAIAGSGIPFANTLGIAGASLTNSLGTNIYTGGKTDISVSLGIASYNFSSGAWGYIGKSGNSDFQNIGYALGAIANISDLYKFTTWDVFSPEQKVLKLQKITSDNSISYDPNLQKSAQYDPNTEGIVFGRSGLKGGMGWAKSTYEHEALHRTDFTNQPTIPSQINSQVEYSAFLDSRAYRLELNNSFQNGLSYKQYIWLQNKVMQYSNIAGISSGSLSNYTILLWLKSLLSR